MPSSRADLEAAPDRSVYRLRHATVLMTLLGGFSLTEPVVSRRVSPVHWAGPIRFHAPPIGIDDLPPIECIVLSHDHVDPLDRNAILALVPTTAHIVEPLGVGDRLIG